MYKISNLGDSESEVESNNAEETSRSQKNALSFHFLYERYESVKQTWPRLGAPPSFILFLRLSFILNTVISITLTRTSNLTKKSNRNENLFLGKRQNIHNFYTILTTSSLRAFRFALVRLSF